MDYSVYEIADGINLSCFPNEKKGASFISVNILTQLSRDTVSINSVLPFVLLKGNKNFPDDKAIKNAMSAAGEMRIAPFSEKYGELQSIGFLAEFQDSFVKQALSLLCELLFKPASCNGAFLPEAVTTVCEELADKVADSDMDLLQRCVTEMCAFEDYAVSPSGYPDEILSINNKQLSGHYKELFQTAPVEIVYIGSAEDDLVANELKRNLSTLARGDINYEIGTDVRLNSVEDEPRKVAYTSFDGLKKCALGYRCGEGYFNYEFTVFQLILMISVNKISKMSYGKFENIETFFDSGKAIFAISASVAGESDRSFEQLFNAVISEIAEGDISNDELSEAVQHLDKYYEGLADDSETLCQFIISSVLAGREPDMDEVKEIINKVSIGEISSAAAGVVPDLVYLEISDI